MSSIGVLEQLEDSPGQAWDEISSNKSGMLGRRVSMASFVIERLWGDGSVQTAKKVNIVIHLLNGALLYWLFRLLLGFYPGVRHCRAISLVCAAIWLLAPLQVSTVLYQVQRMAMLAATFSILSIIAYLHWRRSIVAGSGRPIFLALSILAGILGVFSKENALAIVPVLLITEIYWLQFKSNDESVGLILKRTTIGLTLGGGLLVVLLLMFSWSSLERMHDFREFSLTERLLTQLVILWDYVRQFFIPEVSRLGLYHDDFPVSSASSLNGAIIAGIAWASTIGLCLIALRDPTWRRLAFGPLLFMIGHSLESTVWPLELYFEHRNYLPSIGLAILMLSALSVIECKFELTVKPLMAFVAIYALYLAMLTSSQVTIWSNKNLLALQHVVGHPESARASRDLAQRMAELGAPEGALHYSERAYFNAKLHAAAADEHFGDFVLRDVALACIGGAPLSQDEFKALGSIQPERPLGTVATMKVVVDLFYAEQCPDFEWKAFANHLQSLYLQGFDTTLASAKMFVALAILSNALERWQDAYDYTARSLVLKPNDVQGMLMQLHFATILNKETELNLLKNELLELKVRQKLTRSERDTLALYMDN